MVELDASNKHTFKYIAWDDAVGFENGLMADLNIYPNWYRVAQFPSCESLVSMAI
jgi:hypothetical protein